MKGQCARTHPWSRVFPADRVQVPKEEASSSQILHIHAVDEGSEKTGLVRKEWGLRVVREYMRRPGLTAMCFGEWRPHPALVAFAKPRD